MDLGIAGFSSEVAGLASQPIFRDPFKLICRCDNPPAMKADGLDWVDLEGHPLIVNEAARGLSSPDFQRLANEPVFQSETWHRLSQWCRRGLV